MVRSRPPTPLLVVFMMLLVSAPAQAEYGPESADGYPVNIDGETVYPPAPPVVLTAVDPRIAAAYGLDAGDPLNKAGPLTVYPYYPLLTAEVQRLARDHPDLVKLTSAGKSTAGLDMWLLEIADFASLDAGSAKPLAERETIYLDGGTHSNEYSGVYFTLSIAQFLLDEYDTNETAKWVVENRHVWILPMVNPDGSNAFGRLNAKTVNINRNFPGTWGTVDENPVLNNPGPEPGSEIETQIVTGLMDAIQPDYVNSIHCCGNLWLHPYGAEQLEDPADLQMYTRICDEAFAEVREYCGEIWSTIYPASGTTADEGYERVGASSWTYEMSGRGRIAGPWAEPVTREDVRVQERESWAGIMHALLNAEKYGAHPRLVSLEGDRTSLTAVIENVGYGNLTKGTLVLAGSAHELPFLAPGERTTLTLTGEFVAGPVPATFDWVKRARHTTPGHLSLPLSLAATNGDGLTGILGEGADAIEPLGTRATPEVSIPAPAPLMVLGLLGALAVFRRRN